MRLGLWRGKLEDATKLVLKGHSGGVQDRMEFTIFPNICLVDKCPECGRMAGHRELFPSGMEGAHVTDTAGRLEGFTVVWLGNFLPLMWLLVPPTCMHSARVQDLQHAMWLYFYSQRWQTQGISRYNLNTTEGLGETKQRFYQTEDEDDSSYKTNPLPSPGSWWLSCFNFILWGTLAELEGRIGRPLEDETESCWLVLFVPVHSAVCV